MKTNSKKMFEVICGSHRDSVRVDRGIFETYKDACFEAATQSIEDYMTSDESDVGISIFCVVRIKGNKKENDFVILTHTILRNAGFHDLAKEFERASDSYLSAFLKNKKEK